MDGYKILIINDLKNKSKAKTAYGHMDSSSQTLKESQLSDKNRQRKVGFKLVLQLLGLAEHC